MKQEIWTQMCPLSTYLLAWPHCCTVAVCAQNKARNPTGFIPVTRVVGFSRTQMDKNSNSYPLRPSVRVYFPVNFLHELCN